MNFENYKYFLAAAEELNFTQAAKKLYLTQQALSRQIDKLEKCYNVRLFNREPPMSLTLAGECLYRHICKIMDDEHQLRNELDAILAQENGRLTIGVSYYRCSVLLPSLLAEFTAQYPDIKIELVENTLARTKELLRLGKIDCMFGYHAPDDPTLVSRPMFEEYGVIAISKTLFERSFSPKEQQTILSKNEHRLSEFACCPMVRMAPFGWFGRLFEECCKEEGFEPKVVLESGNLLTILISAALGMGVAVCPSIYQQQLTAEQRKQLYLFRWQYPSAQEKGAILYLQSSYLSAGAKNFIKFSQNYFKTSFPQLPLENF